MHKSVVMLTLVSFIFFSCSGERITKHIEIPKHDFLKSFDMTIENIIKNDKTISDIDYSNLLHTSMKLCDSENAVVRSNTNFQTRLRSKLFQKSNNYRDSEIEAYLSHMSNSFFRYRHTYEMIPYLAVNEPSVITRLKNIIPEDLASYRILVNTLSDESAWHFEGQRAIENAVLQGEIIALENYMTKHPNSRYLKEISHRIERNISEYLKVYYWHKPEASPKNPIRISDEDYLKSLSNFEFEYPNSKYCVRIKAFHDRLKKMDYTIHTNYYDENSK